MLTQRNTAHFYAVNNLGWPTLNTGKCPHGLEEPRRNPTAMGLEDAQVSPQMPVPFPLGLV